MGTTAIPYATRSWVPVHGCGNERVGSGCLHCWARRLAETRLRGRATYPAEDPFKVTLNPAKLDEPLHWRKPQRVFLTPMGDLFHDAVPFRYLCIVFDVMLQAPRHTFMVLTKRVDRALEFFAGFPQSYKPLPNVWVIASASTQAEVDRIAPVLLQIPAAKHGLSLEPLVEEVDLNRVWVGCPHCGAERRLTSPYCVASDCPQAFQPDPLLDWLIVGCESGKDRRYMDPHWARILRDQILACGPGRPAFYYKQAEHVEDKGRWPVVVHPFLDGRQWMEIPA